MLLKNVMKCFNTKDLETTNQDLKFFKGKELFFSRIRKQLSLKQLEISYVILLILSLF